MEAEFDESLEIQKTFRDSQNLKKNFEQIANFALVLRLIPSLKSCI